MTCGYWNTVIPSCAQHTLSASHYTVSARLNLGLRPYSTCCNISSDGLSAERVHANTGKMVEMYPRRVSLKDEEATMREMRRQRFNQR